MKLYRHVITVGVGKRPPNPPPTARTIKEPPQPPAQRDGCQEGRTDG